MKNLKSKLNHLALFASVFVFLLMLTSNAFAQDFPKTSFGIKGGVNFSNFYKGDLDDKDVRTGFNAGVYGRFVLAEGIALQPELLYSTRGGESTYNGFGGGRATLKLDYIEVPVLVVVNVVPFLNIHVGPYVGFLASAKATNVNEDNVFNFEDELDKDSFENVDFGIAGGVGVDINKFHIGARYNYGLRDIGKDKTFSVTSYSLRDQRNSAVQLYVGIDLR
ncbi:MAG: PorT family protein [Verrucomicrobia bacterium]|nr:PorT family protein [Cytophagales bacterium]